MTRSSFCQCDVILMLYYIITFQALNTLLLNLQCCHFRSMRAFLFVVLSLFLSACSDSSIFGGDVNKQKYTELAWEDLKPEMPDLNAESDEEEYSLEIDDQRALDSYYATAPGLSGMQMNVPPVNFSQFSVVEEYNGQTVRVPGFIVPLEYEGESVTEFFLVPYFGACLHNPPPPPNQIIYVATESSVEVSSIYEPFWVEGLLETKQTGNEIATAAYTMQGHKISPYEYE